VITFFTTPKPFAGHIDVIQRNALRSWQRVHPDAEIILFGDDAGAAEVCRELNIRHVPQVRRNAHGTKYLAGIYDQAQELARHEILCHVNCDILLLEDFREALTRVAGQFKQFLMAGRRWDVDIHEPLNFSRTEWPAQVRDLALRTNRQRPAQWIDYFAFRRGLYRGRIPEFVIGRPGWDNWLLWFAHSSGAALIDASSVVCAVHQNHDYGYHPDGEATGDSPHWKMPRTCCATMVFTAIIATGWYKPSAAPPIRFLRRGSVFSMCRARSASAWVCARKETPRDEDDPRHRLQRPDRLGSRRAL